ncbi:hypothetical protein DFP72DRAFT_891798 [Ephemerocybe angulata]|uniref:MARVEL domain-containing protein n=1 Tax=Ephemerocybe angulata TaxID=980116 RepID=A0A8H6I1E4_9AGAR|nr:hypothetical protein DFP72DRAFT_891798 [Tulosesus angulatus]
MGLLDRVSDVVGKFAPKSSKSGGGLAGGIGNGHGMVPFDDNMIVSKPSIIAYSGQIFFNFLSMACYASLAAFQAKYGVGPSGLSGFAIFVSIAGILLSSFMLLVPVAYERYDKFVQLARTLKEVRVSFILTGTGTTFSFVDRAWHRFISTISAWTQPGCKDAAKDPSAEEKGDDFKNGLPGWSFVFWAASVALLIIDWRSGRLSPHRDTPFSRPTGQASEADEEDEDAIPGRQADNGRRYDEESAAIPTTTTTANPFNDPSHSYPSAIPPTTAARYDVPAGRPSMDAYGAFSDPAPTGFGTSYGAGNAGYAPPSQQQLPPQSGYGGNPPPVLTVGQGAGGAPLLPEVDVGPRVSRTMQYADPYAAVRASIGGATSPPAQAPPSYDNYGGGYR